MPRALVVLSVLLASAAYAQSTPPPGGALPTPLTGYIGRYLDAAQTPDPPAGDRLSAEKIKVVPEHDLILMNLGGKRLGAYRMSTFAQRVAQGSLSTGPNGEKYLRPDVFSVNPLDAGSGWITHPVDFREVLEDFDIDDRGYIYLALTVWGFGIVDANGVKQSQILPAPFPATLNPIRILAVRDGTNMLAIVSNISTTAVYDVTNPTAPIFLRNLPFGVAAYAKLAAGGVAVLEVFRREVRIYATVRDLAAGNSPAQAFTPQPGLTYPVYMATDGTAIFTLPSNPAGPTYLSVLTPSGGQYAETRHAATPGFLPMTDIAYGAGFVTLSGFTSGAPDGPRGVFYRTDSFVHHDLSTPYFRTAYGVGPGSGIGPVSLAPYVAGGHAYVIAALNGIGELFTIESPAVVPPPPPPVASPVLTSTSLLALILLLASISLLRLR